MDDINKYRCIHLADKGSGDELCKAIEGIKALEHQIKIKDAYCNMIYMLGVDYDGYETPEGLKSLIDELVALAKRAVKNDDKYAMYEGCGSQNSTKYYNILHEEVEKTKEDEDGEDKM